jgi:hypothetical protein
LRHAHISQLMANLNYAVFKGKGEKKKRVKVLGTTHPLVSSE